MSAGIRSGVELDSRVLSTASLGQGSVGSVVLPSRGTPSNKTCPPGYKSNEDPFDDIVLSNDDTTDFATNEIQLVSQILELHFE